MSLDGIQLLIKEAQGLVTPEPLNTCMHCQGLFAGPPNKRYCRKKCKSREGKKREKITSLLSQLEDAPRLEEEGIRNGDYVVVRNARATKKRCIHQLSYLIDEKELILDIELRQAVSAFISSGLRRLEAEQNRTPNRPRENT